MSRPAYPEHIWHNGRIKPWAEATVHVMAHVVHYGSSVFEGVRCYPTPKGPAIFRLTDHNKRLFASAKIYDMALPYTLEQINEACREVIRANGNTTDYLRPVAYRGLGGFGLSADTPIDVAVATWKMGQYLGAAVLEQGIDACVSSWQRFAPNTIPAGAKAGGNYLSGQLVAREARRLGFGEGIALASTGLLSEGAGENLFLVFDGALHTTPVSAALLNGITRNSIITLAREHDIEVVGARHPARIPVSVRRTLHVRHRGGDHADPFGGRQAGRQRQARAGDGPHAGAVLRTVLRQDTRQVRLAGTGLISRAARAGMARIPGWRPHRSRPGAAR